MVQKTDLVQVEILGQTYSVKSGGDPEYVKQLAAFVDERMKETSRASGAVDSVRIAVLTALNLADECLRLRRESEQGRTRASASGAGTDERLARLAHALDAALRE